ncbi:MAG: hypothetical protein QOD41_1438, partial [Cryptosporangiaceae bacterium]|nr:hypothetical protein [Cryptosporangiaceae bacterium]
MLDLAEDVRRESFPGHLVPHLMHPLVRDADPRVRRRAAEVAPRLGRAATCAVLVELLADPDAWVAEAAAYAIGEHPAPTRAAIASVTRAATGHSDPLVREAAVAALGAQGDP